MVVRKILVIDDEYGIRSGVRQILEIEGYEVTEAENATMALKAMNTNNFDVALIDYRLPDMDGLSLLNQIRKINPDTLTCMITAYANIETAITATREGIDFFLPKPFTPDDLIGVISTLLKHKSLKEEAARLKAAHERSLHELADEKSQTLLLISSLRDGVLVVNKAGEVVLINPAMKTLLDSLVINVQQRPHYRDILGNADFTPVMEVLDKEPDSRSIFELSVNDIQYMVKIVPFRDQSDQTRGHILTFSDITEVKRLALEKAAFIRTMVHELRSPLSVAKSVFAVINDRSLGNNLDAYLPLLNRVQNRLDGMIGLIGDLLSLSRIDMRDHKSGEISSVSVLSAVEAQISEYREIIENRGISVNVDQSLNSLTALAVPDELETILGNLIGNAIKYNIDGGSISIKGWQNKDCAHISVSDTGLGIKSENLHLVFTDFFREKKKETREIIGNGLGLSIVKKLIEKNGGQIKVESIEGEGSTFTFSLNA